MSKLVPWTRKDGGYVFVVGFRYWARIAKHPDGVWRGEVYKGEELFSINALSFKYAKERAENYLFS